MSAIAAELLVLRMRASTWILMGVWVLLGIMFAQLLPYLTYRGGGQGFQVPLSELLPANLDVHLISGFPFFGGVFALMLGVLAIGSDYGWDTIKTVLIQRPGRARMLFAKAAAVVVGLVPFVLSIYAVGAVVSLAIARAENAAVEWPPVWDLVQAFGAGWFIFAAWAAFGMLLAVLSRGTALAIGLGILYTFVIEGIFSALAGEVSWMERFVEFFLRANAYSLVTALGVPADALADNGPGGFFGPFVDGGQALLVLGAYTVAFLAIAATVVRKRDVL